jgi:hypothetical protein
MDYNNQILKEVEELAGLFLDPEEIAILLDLDIDEFSRQLRLKQGCLYRSYFMGKTLAKKEIHTNVVKMAKHGSPLAEEMAHKMITNQERAERATK